MVRLTGRHPFNSEPIPKRLFDSFITPPSLHYVRNHGAVPQVRPGPLGEGPGAACASAPWYIYPV